MKSLEDPDILALREQIIKLERELGAANWRLEEWETARKEAEVADRKQTERQKYKQRATRILISAYLVSCCLGYWGIVGAMVDFVSTGRWGLKPNTDLPLHLLNAAFVLLAPLAGVFFVVMAAGLVWGAVGLLGRRKPGNAPK